MLPCLYLTQHPPAPATPTPPRQSIQCNILNASEPKRAGSGSGRHRQQEKGKGDDEDVHETKAMLVVRRLSGGVRGRCGCGQGQQKGARRLSITTGSSSTNGAGYWGRQYEKAKEAAPVVLAVLGVGAVIWEGSRRLEKLRAEAEKEAGLRAELEKQKATYRLELEKKEAELATRDAVLRGEIAFLRGEVKEKDALRGGEVDRRILDLLTRGDYDRLLEERANARLAGLPPSPPPHSST